MAYLTLTTSEENQGTCFKFIGGDIKPSNVNLISNNTSLISPTVFDGGEDSCSFYSGPSEAAIIAFGENCETSGSIAFYSDSESGGCIAYSGSAESCGSIASGSVSSGSSMGGGCSYSC